MNWKQIMKRIAKWTIPPGIQEVMLSRLRGEPKLDPKLRSILAANKVFQNCHLGERCFILGTGPSINKQDLKPLKHEICFALNFFYLHKDFSEIQPLYYVTGGLLSHPDITYQAGLQWFHDLEKVANNSFLFLELADRQFVQEHSLFQNTKVYYWQMRGDWRWDDLPRKGIDLTKPIYDSHNVAVITLQIALYMGFREIYLLGLDHDWIVRYAEQLPLHFYKPENSPVERRGPIYWGYYLKNWKTLFYSQWALWEQYEKLKSFAEQRGVKIYNATEGGILDVFERIEYSLLFPGMQ